jgi:hypothetical protein
MPDKNRVPGSLAPELYSDHRTHGPAVYDLWQGRTRRILRGRRTPEGVAERPSDSRTQEGQSCPVCESHVFCSRQWSPVLCSALHLHWALAVPEEWLRCCSLPGLSLGRVLPGRCRLCFLGTQSSLSPGGSDCPFMPMTEKSLCPSEGVQTHPVSLLLPLLY